MWYCCVLLCIISVVLLCIVVYYQCGIVVKKVLDVFQKTGIDSWLEGEDIVNAKNVGSRVYDQGIVTYKQSKLGLFGYCEKRYVLTDGIHRRLLEFWPLNNFFLKHTEKQKCHVNTVLCIEVPKRSKSYFIEKVCLIMSLRQARKHLHVI